MSKKMMGLFLGGVLCLSLFIFADQHPKSAIEGIENVYYGHISFTEVKHDGKDPVVIREGEANEEVAVLNLPLTAGDTILTPYGRRCEIQFDTGTILRLDENTELKLETLLADSLSSKQKMTNLVLERGRIYVMYKRYTGKEVFQIKTPKTAVKLDHNSVVLIHSRNDYGTDVRVLEGKVYVMFGPEDLMDFTTAKVKKEQQLTITADNHIITNEYQNDADFMAWNLDLNENFVETHEGKTYIPLPIQKYPKAVFYFAQKYANLYGEWIYDRMLGYVWRPFYNDYYPDGSWQPYYYGHWRRLEGELFWVPAESWGWVPYHLGVWQWDEKRGWLWIPGDAFAPAWAMWDFYFGYYAWRPWSMWDWYYFGQDGYYGIAWLWYHQVFPYSWSGYWSYCNPGWGSVTSFFPPKYLSTVTKDQLQKPANPPYNIPDKMRNACKITQKALEQGEKRVLESIRAVSSQMVFVQGKYLDSADISQRALRLKDITLPAKSWNGDLKPISDPYQAAVKAHWDAEGASTLRQYMFGGQKSSRHTADRFNARELSEKAGAARSFGGTNQTNPSASIAERTFSGEIKAPRTLGSRSIGMAVRDWNPDIKYARMAGVSIVYSSKSNEITCPEIGLTSGKVANSRSGIRKGSSGSVSSGMSAFLSFSAGSSGGSGSSGSSSHGSMASSGRGSSSGGGSRGSSGSKK